MKLEIRNWELEIRECGLELFSNFDFLFSASDFPGGKI